MRHSPTSTTQATHHQKSQTLWEVRFYLVEKYIVSPHVRSRTLSGLEYDKTHLGKHYPIRGGHQMLSLAPMNSALSGDERTRRYGDTGMGASETLGTSPPRVTQGPPRVTTGPWPSLPAGALFSSNLKCLSSKPFSFNSLGHFKNCVYTEVNFKSMKVCFL